jgi:predicted nucleotidyltransferase
MKKIAVICEYNPFHAGHEYQIKKAKSLFPDSAVIAIMSGHFTQRGEAAAFSKFTRAKAALKCGCDLVLELPFPFSSGSAEFFAYGGCDIAKKIGADMLLFGSESGDIEELKKLSDKLSSKEFKKSLADMRKSHGTRSLGHAALVSSALDNDHERELISQPNNILALEYLSALKDSGIEALTVKRVGAGYSDTSHDSEFPSATALRKLLSDGENDKFISLLPCCSSEPFQSALDRGEYVRDASKLNDIYRCYFRFSNSRELSHMAECGGGITNKIVACALRSATADEFFASLRSKNATDAKIRRAMLFGMLNVSADMLKSSPCYTQLLAANKAGCELLSEIKKQKTIDILTKPTDIKNLSDAAKAQLIISQKADALYTLLTEKQQSAQAYLRSGPYIEK